MHCNLRRAREVHELVVGDDAAGCIKPSSKTLLHAVERGHRQRPVGPVAHHSATVGPVDLATGDRDAVGLHARANHLDLRAFAIDSRQGTRVPIGEEHGAGSGDHAGATPDPSPASSPCLPRAAPGAPRAWSSSTRTDRRSRGSRARLALHQHLQWLVAGIAACARVTRGFRARAARDAHPCDDSRERHGSRNHARSKQHHRIDYSARQWS